jgi:hypothetical protein
VEYVNQSIPVLVVHLETSPHYTDIAEDEETTHFLSHGKREGKGKERKGKVGSRRARK